MESDQKIWDTKFYVKGERILERTELLSSKKKKKKNLSPGASFWANFTNISTTVNGNFKLLKANITLMSIDINITKQF